MKTYKIYEQKLMLVPIATGVAEESLKEFGEVETNIYGEFSSTSAEDGKVVGKKLKSGIKRFYAFEEK